MSYDVYSHTQQNNAWLVKYSRGNQKVGSVLLIWRLYKMRFSIKKHYPTYAPGESTRDNDKIRVKTVFCPLKNSY